MSRDALTRLFPDGKTVFIPADGQPMPRYEDGARRDRSARRKYSGGRVAAELAGIFSWLFGGGGADDAEEFGRAGSDDRDRDQHRRSARRPQRRRLSGARAAGRGRRCRAAGGRQGEAQLADRSGLRQRPRIGAGAEAEAPEPQAEVADVGPQAVAKAKRNLPTGQAYASAAESAGAARRRSSRRRSPNWSSPMWPATLRRTSRAAPPGRSSSRRCRRASRPISRPSPSPTRPCLRFVRRI